MKKPYNKFTVAMWIAAALVAVINVAQIYEAIMGFRYSYAQGGTMYLVIHGFLAGITGTIAPVAMLVGFGALLEMVDNIRWQNTPRE